MERDLLLHAGALVLLLGCSAFFSASEAALFSLNQLKVRHLQSRGGRGLLVARLLTRPRQLIITFVISNEVINITASSLTGAYLIGLLGPQGRWYAIGVMSFLLLVAGEIIPKTVAVSYPAGVALFAAPLISRLHRLAAGPAALAQRLSRGLAGVFGGEREADRITGDDFKSLVREGGKLGVLDRDEEDIITNILELGERTAADLMVPRTEIVALEADMTAARALEIMRERGHSRAPVYEGSLDGIVGVLHVKDLAMRRARGELKGDEAVRDLVRQPFLVPEHMPADELLLQFRNRRARFAVVVDEYGGTAGVVTLGDLLRRLFEEVARGVEEDMARQLGAGVWLVPGRMTIEEFNERFGSSFSDEHYNTVGGMLLHLFGRLPLRGEAVRSGDFLFRVAAVGERRITGVRVERRGGGRGR